MSDPFPAACLYLSGPTASGKTSVGVELARLVDGEIVAMDSMTLYRGLDVGTAKPTPAERAAVPHHLVDVLDPHEECSQAEYVALARQAVDDILARGKTPVFVGGTPLYLKTLLRGMFDGPPADWEFRRRIEREAATHEGDWLHRQVAAFDPPTAARLHPRDARRLIRAWEVFHLTGTPISVHQRQFEAVRGDVVGRVFVLQRPRDELHRRIEQRVDAMLADGLVDEVRRLVAGPQPLSRTAGQALGYRELLDFLAGKCDLPTAAADIKTHTRQFAKRQLTWFRSLAECREIAVEGANAPATIAAQIAAVVDGG